MPNIVLPCENGESFLRELGNSKNSITTIIIFPFCTKPVSNKSQMEPEMVKMANHAMLMAEMILQLSCPSGVAYIKIRYYLCL